MLLSLVLHTPLLGLVLGPIVTLLGNYIHKLWPWLDAQSAPVKQAFAVILAFALVGLSQLVPGVAPAECANTLAQGVSSACEAALSSGAFLQSVVSALVAIAVKHGQQNAAAKS